MKWIMLVSSSSSPYFIHTIQKQKKKIENIQETIENNMV